MKKSGKKKSKAKATAAAGNFIDLRQWRVLGQLRHDGITYGTAEPLPKLTLAEATLYEKQGTLVRLGDETVAEAYLQGSDAAVLQEVLERGPDRAVLDQMIKIVQRNSRSKVLELALMIAVKGRSSAAPSDR